MLFVTRLSFIICSYNLFLPPIFDHFFSHTCESHVWTNNHFKYAFTEGLHAHLLLLFIIFDVTSFVIHFRVWNRWCGICIDAIFRFTYSNFNYKLFQSIRIAEVFRINCNISILWKTCYLILHRSKRMNHLSHDFEQELSFCVFHTFCCLSDIYYVLPKNGQLLHRMRQKSREKKNGWWQKNV